MARRHAGMGRECGSVTVEFALGLPTLILVLAFALSGAAWALEVQAAQGGAGEAARAAIVDRDAEAVGLGRRVSGQSEVTVSRAAGYVTACVVVAHAPWPRAVRCATARDRP